jgi:hypothetical protein
VPGAYALDVHHHELLLRESLGVPAAVTARTLQEALALRLIRLAGDHGAVGPEQRQDATSAVAVVAKGLRHGALDLAFIGEDDPTLVVARLTAGVQSYVDRARLERYTTAAVAAVIGRVRVLT